MGFLDAPGTTKRHTFLAELKVVKFTDDRVSLYGSRSIQQD